MQEQIRRHQNTLVILGTGVIIFGVWSFVKMIAYYFLNPAYIQEYADRSIPMGLFFGTLYVFLAVDLLLRVYVGLSARAVGFGRKNRTAYLAACGLILVLHGMAVASGVWQMRTLDGMTADRIISFIIDLTAVIILLELIIASVKLKRLRKCLPDEEEPQCS